MREDELELQRLPVGPHADLPRHTMLVAGLFNGHRCRKPDRPRAAPSASTVLGPTLRLSKGRWVRAQHAEKSRDAVRIGDVGRRKHAPVDERQIAAAPPVPTASDTPSQNPQL